jgi:hypothetical protein
MTRAPSAARRALFAGLLPGLLAVLLYWRAPFLGFAGDDALVLYHLKRLGGLANAWAYFDALDFFHYYRPVGFLTFASDAAAWGWRPAGFHLTNVLLHAINTVLVFALGRRLLSVPGAALAAVLFAVHASNQEAVYWISARFDLLAACGVLASVLLMTRSERPSIAAGLGAFALAMLAKESALSAPIVVGAYEVFVRRSRPGRVVPLLAAMLAVIGGYALMRSAIGGLDPAGGASRLPKAVALLACVVALMALSATGWSRLASVAAKLRAMPVAALGVVLVAGAVAVSLQPAVGAPIREKLSFAGVAGFYLLSPVVAPAPPPFFLDPATPVYWTGGLVVAAVTGAGLFAWRARLFANAIWLFVAVAVAGALLPVSSLTEGQRYFYLGSVGVALGTAKLVVDAAGRWRRPATVLVALYVAVCAWQLQVKGADWQWATGMLSRAVALVNADLPACDQGDVVFLTAPVGVRGVYSHFYHQTFSQDGGCEPGSFRAIARMVRTDQDVEVRWTSPRTLALLAPDYQGNFVLSSDLRSFVVEQRSRRLATLDTPMGRVTSRPRGRAQAVTLDLPPTIDLERTRFYVFSRGEVRRVAPDARPRFQ